MEFKMHEISGIKIAELFSPNTRIESVQDALDLIGNADYQGARKVILFEEQLSPLFFQLKTKLAGEILQKFSNYHVSLAVVGDFSKYSSKALRDFIYESNQGRLVYFASDLKQALDKLSN